MNCFHHHEQVAVAQCSDCGRGLCPSCASRFSISLCTECFNRRVTCDFRRIVKDQLTTLGFGLVLAALIMKNHETVFPNMTFHHAADYVTVFLILFYFISGTVAGWKTLTAITPRIFLFMPILGWAFYFLAKLALSFCIGPVMLPLGMARAIIRLNRLKKAELPRDSTVNR